MAKKSTPWTENDLVLTWEEKYPSMGYWLQEVRSELNRAKLPGISMFPRFGITMDMVREWWEAKTPPRKVPALVKPLL